MLRLTFTLALVAACGVEIGGKQSSNNPDAPKSPDAAIDDAPGPDARPCTGGAMNTTADGTCLMLFTTPRYWADAQTACTQIGARLAVLDTAAKHAAAKILSGTNNTWIGLEDRTSENQFRWVDPNVPLAFTAWDPMEPNNGGNVYEEDCAVIAGARAGDWDDRPCSDQITGVTPGCCTYAYLCQF